MNKLIKLAKVLNSLGLNKESAQLIYLAKTAEVANEDEMNNLAPHSIPKIELEEDFGISSSTIKKIKELGITLLNKIGSGGYGNVFSGVYDSKPVAVKVVVGPIKALNNDVENWNQVKNKIDSFPDFVKVLFPRIFFTYKDKDNNGRDVQILVMERLRHIPKELSDIFKGDDESMAMEELVSTAYPDIKSMADSLTLQFPTLRQILKFIADKKLKPFYMESILLDYFMSLIPIEEIEYEEDEPPEEGYNDIYSELIQKIEKLCADILEIAPEPMPISGGKQFGGNERLWEARGGLENFWKGIAWLRDAGYSVSDLHSKNIMMDDLGNLKISDLGGFNFASDLGESNL